MNPSGIGASESVVDRSSAPLRLAQLQRYGLAVPSVGVALGASLLLQHFHLRDAGVPLLLFAVAISSWYGGTGPAALAVILSMISFYWYFVDPVTGVEDQDVRTPTARPGPGIHSKAIVALVKKAPERAGPDEF